MNNSKNKIFAFIPGIGSITESSGMSSKHICSDGVFQVKKNGIESITATGDGKVEFITFSDHAIAYVKSAMGYPAYYPVPQVHLKHPVKYVLMDLDGTSVRSEKFWMWIIQLTIAKLMSQTDFKLSNNDMPYVSGHSVSEHLQYCIDKYCPDKSIVDARNVYSIITKNEMQAIIDGDGYNDAFEPTPGLKDFLLKLKKLGVKIALVTSGLYEKAWPEIKSAFDSLGLGSAEDFYDAIITAGSQPGHGRCGTLGELEAKPHPWLYAEAAIVGLNIPNDEREQAVGIEDSGAGICSIRLAGFTAIGFGGGNIIESGTKDLCSFYSDRFDKIYDFITGDNN